jgi:hypothetical protein
VIVLLVGRIVLDVFAGTTLCLPISLIAAVTLIPYFLLSQRVKATFAFGQTAVNGVASRAPAQIPPWVVTAWLFLWVFLGASS